MPVDRAERYFCFFSLVNFYSFSNLLYLGTTRTKLSASKLNESCSAFWHLPLTRIVLPPWPFFLSSSRLQNSRFFFLKISKEIGKAWRKSLTRANHASLTRPSLTSLALCFQPSSTPFVWLLARTWIRKNTECFAVYTVSKRIRF